MSTEFAACLKKLMKAQGKTIRSIAVVAGTSPSTVQGWLNGSHAKDYKALKRVATELGVTLCYLLTGEEEFGQASLDSVLDDGGSIFSGICEISIRRLVPKKR